MSPLGCSVFSPGALCSCCVCCVYLIYTYSRIEATCPSIPAARFASRLCLFVLFLLFVVVLSDEPRAGVGRPQTSSSPPVIFIAGRPKAALLVWFFGDFRCGALLFMVIHVIYI